MVIDFNINIKFMKKISVFISLILIQNLVFGQNQLKNYTPKSIYKIDLSVKGEKDFERRDALLEKRNLTAIERKELDTLLSKYGEELEDYWDIIGGGCSWYCGGGNYDVKASSYLNSEKGLNYKAKNGNDLSYQTAWVEGKNDAGIGEFIEYYFKNRSPRITKIIVSNGYVKSETAWKNNNRVKKLKLYVNDKAFGVLNLEDSRSDQVFELGTFGRNPNKADLILKFEILEVYKGEKFNDTAITEIYFDGIDVH
jgi:hypothetical protein